MAAVNSLANEVESNLMANGQDEQVAAKIGGSVSKMEDRLLKLYSAPEFKTKEEEAKWLKANGFGAYSTLEGAQQAMNVKYQRALRAMEAFMTLMRNSFETMMSAIRNLKVG